MINILLSICSSTFIFIIFKFLERKNIESFPVIIINYLVAAFIGFLFTSQDLQLKAGWQIPSAIIGILFILLFFVLSHSTRKAGIAVTTVAAKLSVVGPIVFSMLYDESDNFNLVKLSGITLAVAAVILTVYKKDRLISDPKKIYLPLILFIGMGLVDSLVKYSQMEFITENGAAGFTSVLFFISFLSGLLFMIFRPEYFKTLLNLKSLAWGLGLGIVNFGSIYFLISALNNVNISGIRTDSSIIFGINNSGIVVLSVISGILVFKEKLSLLNRVGIGLSLVAIVIFSLS